MSIHVVGFHVNVTCRSYWKHFFWRSYMKGVCLNYLSSSTLSLIEILLKNEWKQVLQFSVFRFLDIWWIKLLCVDKFYRPLNYPTSYLLKVAWWEHVRMWVQFCNSLQLPSWHVSTLDWSACIRILQDMETEATSLIPLILVQSWGLVMRRKGTSSIKEVWLDW